MYKEQQNYQDHSPISSTTPMMSEGLYPAIAFLDHNQSGINFEKFNRDISDLLDQINLPIPDFFSAQNNYSLRSGCQDSILDYHYSKFAASQQLESSQLDFHFLHEFQKNLDKKESNSCSNQIVKGQYYFENQGSCVSTPKSLLLNQSKTNQYQQSFPSSSQSYGSHQNQQDTQRNLFQNHQSKSYEQLPPLVPMNLIGLSNIQLGISNQTSQLSAQRLDEILSSTAMKTDDLICSNESTLNPKFQSNQILHEKITTNLNEHIDKLLADLDFIERPLVGKRIRKTKKQIAERQMQLQIQNKLLQMQGMQIILTEKEKRERKKQQQQVLMNEYLKNKNWSKPYIKELSKQLGLSGTQIYKWNWDQRKKDIALNNQTNLISKNTSNNFDTFSNSNDEMSIISTQKYVQKTAQHYPRKLSPQKNKQIESQQIKFYEDSQDNISVQYSSTTDLTIGGLMQKMSFGDEESQSFYNQSHL
eukprot:403344396